MITWSSKKQSMVALSSTKVEYIAVISASAQALWLRKILEELCEIQSGATILYCDNKSAIQLAQNPIHHSRSKHFDMKYHFIRDMVEKKIVELRHPTLGKLDLSSRVKIPRGTLRILVSKPLEGFIL